MRDLLPSLSFNRIPTITLLFFFSLFWIESDLSAQGIDHRPGDILIQLHSEYNPAQFSKTHTIFEGRATQLQEAVVISPQMNIFRFTFDYGSIHEGRFLTWVRKSPMVSAAQLNHRVDLRQNTPNDPLFPEQWYLNNTGQNNGLVGADIGALESWDITTGGVTALGDTIVIAVIDDGINIDHPDLQGIIWKNKHEVEGTGTDSDGNGYIDDIYGWNTFDNSGIVFGDNFGGHGTPVSGMIGTLSNNGVGIAAINWNIKIMSIVGGWGPNSIAFESNVLQSYNYALTQRQIYNESNGERGAFVVATNSSWGRDRAKAEDSPLWCAFYDEMGQNGILSVGATTNRNDNVDEVGDLPTSCPSEYLISVTSTNRLDNRSNTGFGRQSIELGAPGSQVYSTRNNGDFSPVGGTSFAAPLTAGVIGLLYSAPCESLIQIAKDDPARAASMVRQYILDGVDPLLSLKELTSSGGRLNAANALNELLLGCSECPAPGSVSIDSLSHNNATFSWTEVSGTEEVQLRYRIDSSDWTVLTNASSPLALDLIPCSNYEFEIQAVCDTLESDWIRIDSFKTEGCCEAPTEFSLTYDTSTSVTISWNEIIPAFEYNIRFRAYGDEFWQITDLWPNSSITFDGLESCHIYEAQVQARCDTGFTTYSESIIIETPECVNCTDLVVCEPEGIDAGFEWIDTAIIGVDTLPTGPGEGYNNRTSGLAGIFNLGDTLGLRLVPGYSGNIFSEYFRIWIDLNRDGIYAPNELIFDAGRNVSEALDTVVYIPGNFDIEAGHARMRIQMEYMENPDSIPPPVPCKEFEFGQVNDYCIFLHRPFISCPEVLEARTKNVTEGSFIVAWDSTDFAIAYNIRYRSLGSSEWEEKATPDTTFLIEGLEPCTAYEVQLRSICSFDTSDYTVSFVLFTECPNNVDEIEEKTEISVKTYPNPFSANFSISINTSDGTAGSYQMNIYNLHGQFIHSRSIRLENNYRTTIQIDQLRSSPPGMYLIEFTDGIRRKVVKVIKQ